MRAASRKQPLLSLISLGSSAVALTGLIVLGKTHDILNSGSLTAVMLYVAGGSIGLLCGLAAFIRHEGRWSWLALAAVPLLVLTGWMLRH
jgi:hypothetical protein